MVLSTSRQFSKDSKVCIYWLKRLLFDCIWKYIFVHSFTWKIINFSKTVIQPQTRDIWPRQMAIISQEKHQCRHFQSSLRSLKGSVGMLRQWTLRIHHKNPTISCQNDGSSHHTRCIIHHCVTLYHLLLTKKIQMNLEKRGDRKNCG